MERKEAEDANNKKPTESNNKDSDEDHMHHVAINHQRSSQLEVINSNRIKDTLKLKSFRALFKTHALTFPSNNEEDSEIAKAENKAHLAHIRMRREYGTDIYIYIYIYIYMCVCVCVCSYMLIYSYAHTYICSYMYMIIHTCAQPCTHTHTPTHTHTHIYIYIYIYI